MTKNSILSFLRIVWGELTNQGKNWSERKKKKDNGKSLTQREREVEGTYERGDPLEALTICVFHAQQRWREGRG